MAHLGGNQGLDGRPSAVARHGGTPVHAWYGLRYAQVPARFAAPDPAGGRLHAHRLADVPVFPQLPSRLAAAMGEGRPNPHSEQAFFANVWAPAQADGLPVVLFIHGGAWTTGGGSMEWYDGGALAARGLVVVTVNYRIGALGHLGRAEAHALPLPAADLLLALRWTAANAAAYGGDPGRITIAGQSAGGWYGHLLSVLPETRGMIRRVAHLSMGTRAPWTPRQQAEVTLAAGRALPGGVDGADVGELLPAGARALQAWRADPGNKDTGNGDAGNEGLGHAASAYLPVASAGLPGRLLDPGWAAEACHAEAVYLRYTGDESAMFFFGSDPHLLATQGQVDDALGRWEAADLPEALIRNGAYAGADSGLSPYRQLVAASSWRQFQRFPSEYAGALRADGRDVTLEVFEEESPQPHLHSAHCLDLPFQFGTREAWADAPMLRGLDPDRFEAVSERLVSGLARFAGAG